jgi:hypothetical protein
MDTKPVIEFKINETLNSAKKVNSVDVPAFFTEKTVNKLRASVKQEQSYSYKGLLKIAAIVVLLIANTYTVKYILSPKQDTTTNQFTVKDLVNEYQPNDADDITFEENLNK